MFSVKLKDCFLHHLTWMDYRMVLLVPLGEKDRLTHSLDSATHHLPPTPHTSDPQEGQEGQGQSSETGHKPAGGGGGERRRRRKPVLKELSGYDVEEGADDDDMSTSTTSSVHVPGPCFSVYELRNKLFMTLSPNAVYIYTYKNQIKSFKLPIHWVYILKRMGGMLESCHTCRLMDLEHVRGMCTHYGLSLPDTLDSLCRNELPKGRRVIDLSSIEPESLGPLHLEEIPLCSFTEKGRPYKPKSKKNKKKWRKDEEHRSKRKADMVDQETRRSSGKDQGGEVKESVGGGGRKVPKASTSSSVGGERELLEGEEEVEGEEEGEREEEEEGGEREGGAGNWALNKKEKHHKLGKRSPPPLIKRPLSPISSRTKKKPCPFCGAQVLKRSKKCSACNKNFGVYTFGRKQCLYCGRVNLARMARCNECGQSLDKAPSARPKEGEESCVSSYSSHKRSDFIFGVRKRRKVHSVPLAFSGGFYSGYHSHQHQQHQQLASSSPSTSSFKMRRSNEQSPVESGHGAPGEVVSDEEEMEEGWREEGGGEEGGGEEGGEDTQEEEVLTNKTPATDGETAVKTKTKSRTKSTSLSNPKQAGYRYGHIPWADADITVLVDEKGVTKFCLQELIAKVMAGHTKAEVFDMVRDLDLPLEQGNLQLLKKLQALGLHANRSPMCKLIATEELWLLLDALQEPVPEEVHQHLENINTSSTPLLVSYLHHPSLSPGSISIRTAAVVATAPPTTNSAEEEEQTKSFESTLHEMQCSDGQYISVLRKWNGEQYVCLPEMWRKYFPEVNRNHLSSALRRLELETLMPTAQQATLLRSAQVISIRGAPGRLMKLEHMQALLDDFCIPLQLATGSTQEHDPASKDKVKQAVSSASTTGVLKPVSSRPVGRPRLHIPQSSLPPGKVLASREDMEYAQCMRNVLTSVNSSDLVALLEETRLESEQQADVADSHANDVDSQLDRLGQLIHTRRELSTVLSREMGFVNASAHGYMSEVVRITHTERQVLQNLDTLLSSLKISLL
ncbi:hypothetical protein GBAR_LOCUS30905 [Geodia barretti]|uniref:Uncharacterized protein n=2 Tax=Geodia barretti TaxID=519541 RepID=A0AA35TYA4_GEOBA|nr:hypothetical protein GBAR_LOCUS30905 [Geodia barretti]